MKNISGLIQSESPSVVIARFDKELMLLVTGLESQEKKDFRDRPIRHSIAWVCNDNRHDEMQIRKVKPELKKYLSLIEEIEKLLKESFD